MTRDSHTRAVLKPTAVALTALAVTWVTLAHVGAQAGGAANAAGPQMAEEVFKNVQLLRGIPVDQFMGTMGVFSAATGLNCTDCHGEESGGNWAKYADENARKQMARRMMQMVETLNKTSFGGRQVVTCFTCHRGTSRPTVMPSIDLLYSSPPPTEPGDIVVPARNGPTVDQVFEKYIQALGGASRLGALKSLAGKGTYIGFDDAAKTAMELYAEAPAKRLVVGHSASGDLSWVFDGQAGWMAAPTTDRPLPVIPVTGQDLEGFAVEAQVLFPLGLRERLRNIRVGLSTEIGDREVQVVQGTTASGGVVTLCFDDETGLLTRLVRYSASPVGRIVTRVDYGNYREVNGVKVPFTWTLSWLNGRSTFELETVQANVAVDASRFARPSAPAAR